MKIFLIAGARPNFMSDVFLKSSASDSLIITWVQAT